MWFKNSVFLILMFYLLKLLPITADAILSALKFSFTSCTLKIDAPLMRPITLVATVPSTRSSLGRSRVSPTTDFLEVPRRTGKPSSQSLSTVLIAVRFYSNDLAKPTPGSRMILSFFIPLFNAQSTILRLSSR